jgi:drug/metabolite transporter (DMT)-like permease
VPLNPATRLAYLAWMSVCLVWGTTYLAIRVALETIPPALLGGLRFTIAGAILATVLVARGVRLPGRVHWGGMALVGALMIGAGNGGVIWAEQWVPSGIAAVIVASAPFWMAIIEAVLPGGERFSKPTLAGMCIGFGGILLLVWPDLTTEGAWGRQFLFGVIAIQLAEIGWSLGTSYSKRQARQENALAASALHMVFGGLLMLAIGTLRGEWSDLSFTARTVGAELYLIVVGSLAGYSAYIYALKYLPVSTVSLYAYVNPVIAVFLGTLLLNEPFSGRIVAASALVLVGIAVARPRHGAGTDPKVQGPGVRAGRVTRPKATDLRPGTALGPDS